MNSATMIPAWFGIVQLLIGVGIGWMWWHPKSPL